VWAGGYKSYLMMSTAEKTNDNKNTEKEESGGSKDENEEHGGRNESTTEKHVDRDDGEDSHANNDRHVNVDMMIDKKLLCIDDLPELGGKPSVAYGNVNMPRKLYCKQTNIEGFTEDRMVEEWRVTKLWWAWLKAVDLETVIEKKV
jgi:hypothetical protein